MVFREYEPSQQDLEHLREWLKKMPHIVQDYDDAFLAAFVRGCKGSLQKTKSVLENFNAMGMRNPEIFGSLDPFKKRLQDYLGDVYNFRLPKKLNGDTVVTITKVRPDPKGDLDKSHPIELFRYLYLLLYIVLWEDDFGPGKYVPVIDFTGVTISHVREFNPMILKILAETLITATPVRLSGVHILNLPTVLEWIINIFKSVLPKKLADRMHLHSTLESLHSQVSKEILPKELGGDDESLATLHDNWKQRVESYRSRFLEEENKIKSLNGIRAKMMKVEDTIGTFRALTVD